MKAGVPRHRLDEWVATGRVRRVMLGVYLRNDLADTHLTRAQAAALVISPFAVACDRTASWIHEVDTFEFRELEMLPPLETFVLRGRARTKRKECSGGERDLAARDICAIEGVATTTPLRTALDLGCKLKRYGALAALDGFMRKHAITREEMEAELSRYRGRRGVVQLRRLIPLADPRAESPGESFTRMAMIDEGLPVPELQWWVREFGRDVFRLDLAYPKSRVVVEYDGRDWHDSDEQRKADKVRREWLRDRQWTVIVVRRGDFRGEALMRWINEVREALRVAI